MTGTVIAGFCQIFQTDFTGNVFADVIVNVYVIDFFVFLFVFGTVKV